jgi:hypothetical protein
MTRSTLFLALLSLSACAGKPGPAADDAPVPAGPTLDVLMWFDTEDYLLPASDDAALRLAEFLTAENVRATFKVVGEKARTLEARGRTDVIAALRKHEIGYHSNWHSVHPTPAQYLSALGWDEGVEEFLRREGPGARDVERIFGQRPSCYGQPGSSWGPQSFGALRQLGIPVYLDAGSHVGLDRKPHWFGGALTLFQLADTLRTGLSGPHDLEEAQKRFTAARERIQKQGGGVAHVFYHPCEWVHREFWDGVNFRDGANPPREEWRQPPQKTPEQTKAAFETFEAYVRWMKAQPGVRFLTARDALALYRDRARGRYFEARELDEVAAAAGEGIGFQVRGDLALAPSEIFLLLNARLANAEGALTYGLHETPFGPSEPGPAMAGPVTATWSQVQRTSRDVADYVLRHGRIPSAVWLGSQAVTPESWLAAVAKLLPQLKTPPATVEFKPAALSTSKHVSDDSEKLWGWLFPKGWHAPRMMELARRQAWTIKPAIRGSAQ